MTSVSTRTADNSRIQAIIRSTASSLHTFVVTRERGEEKERKREIERSALNVRPPRHVQLEQMFLSSAGSREPPIDRADIVIVTGEQRATKSTAATSAITAQEWVLPHHRHCPYRPRENKSVSSAAITHTKRTPTISLKSIG